jgi:hypothetical protein
MFVLEDVGDAVDLADRHFAVDAALHHLVAGHRADPFDDHPVDLVACRQALALIAIAIGSSQFRFAHHRGEAFEHLVGGARDGHPLVVDGAEMPVRNGDEAAGALAFADLAEEAVSGGDFVHLAEHRLVDADVDDLAFAARLAVAQCQQDADRAVETGQVITHRRGAGDHRRLAGEAGEVGEPGETMRDVREARTPAIRSGLPVARDAQHYQAGVGLAQRVPAEPPFLHRTGTEVLDQHIRLGDQFEEQIDPFLLAEVEGHRFPVAAFAEPGQRRIMTFRRGAETAHRITGDRVLDLEDFGTELAEDRRGIGAGQKGANVDHAQAAHRQLVVFARPLQVVVVRSRLRDGGRTPCRRFRRTGGKSRRQRGGPGRTCSLFHGRPSRRQRRKTVQRSDSESRTAPAQGRQYTSNRVPLAQRSEPCGVSASCSCAEAGLAACYAVTVNCFRKSAKGSFS